MSKKLNLNLSESEKHNLNVSFAVEIIRKLLFETETISSKEFQNVVKIANRSVKK